MEQAAHVSTSPLVAPMQRSLAHATSRGLGVLERRWPAVALLAGLSGVLYLVNLTVSGYANTYYALAAQAGSQSWTAMFFGSLDASGFITLDKPPLSTWLMAVSVRAFGLSSWSILLPQALLGIGTVVVLYLAVRRSFGSWAGLFAGIVMATTPVAVLIFRYDNPDALLTFLLVSAAWALLRGLDGGRLRWALLAATLIGLAFLTKFLQAYLVLPAFALAWLVAAPVSLRRRIGGLLASGLVVALTSGWWVAIVELLPPSARPYVGGSEGNSVMDLILGYDGLGRIFGGTPGAGLGSNVDGAIGRGGPTFGGDPGLLRLFNEAFGGQVAWLLPAAAVALVALAIILLRARREDPAVGALLLWGGWLVTHAVVFSLMAGIIHPYYTVVIAPAVAALVGAGAVELWRRRGTAWARLSLAATIVGSGGLAWILLDRTPSFLPGLGLAVLALAIVAAVLISFSAAGPERVLLTRLGVAAALVALLTGPIAYSGATMANAYAGGDPSAGPPVAAVATLGRGALGPGNRPSFGDAGPDGSPGPGGPGGAPPPLGEGRPGGPVLGVPDVTVNARLTAYLVEHRGDASWLVAVNGANAAATLQLATGEPVMAMGGFSGSDPWPTLDAFRTRIGAGELRFVLLGLLRTGSGPVAGPRGPIASDLTRWVTTTCTQVSIDGATVGLYDCWGVA